jgi:hypothetical protein
LEKILAAAGVPAVISSGDCKAAEGSNADGIANVIEISKGRATITAAAIPSGDELAIGIYNKLGGKKLKRFFIAFNLT